MGLWNPLRFEVWLRPKQIQWNWLTATDVYQTAEFPTINAEIGGSLYFCLPGFKRLLISPIRWHSVICPSQWEPRQRRGGRCLSRDMKKWRTATVSPLLSDTCFHDSVQYSHFYIHSEFPDPPVIYPHSIFYIEDKGDLLARCHYCTHYSSAIIVASFLVRMEPFSNTFQTLQVRRWTQHAPWPNWQTVQGISVFLLFLIIVFVSWTRQAFLSMLHWTCGV